MAGRDPYEVLELNKNATKEDVKAAYRQLAKKYHPDHYVNNPLADLAKEKFIEVQEAYDTIINGTAGETYYGGGGYDAKYQQAYDNSSQGRVPTLSEVRAMIERGDIFNAKLTLNRIMEKNAEWYFLSGVADSRLGSYNSGLNYLRMAIQMEPNNQEYKTYFDSINEQMSQYNRSHGYYNNRTGSVMGTVCQLIMCDTCCECCGCDCIPCI